MCHEVKLDKDFTCSFKDDGNSSANYWPIGSAVQAVLSNYSTLLSCEAEGSERIEKSFHKRKQVSISEMNESESTDEVTKALKLSGKSTSCEGSVKERSMNLFTGCVPTVIQAT